MQWRGRKKRKAIAGEQLATQVEEFFDPYTDRTYLDEPGSAGRVVMQPGKMLDKLRERMERVVLDPLNIEVAVEDFLTFDEVSMLVSNTFGGLLVAVTAEHAADLLAREFPRDLASQPILSYDTRSVGLDIRDDLQAIARDILNSQTSEDPRRDLDQVDEQVSGLEVGDQVSVYVAVLALYLRKLHQLAATTRPE
jgi:hypothetical protein